MRRVVACFATALLCTVAPGLHAADRALVLTIGQYAGDLAPPLPGVARDRDHALAILQRLGFAPAAVRTLADAQLDGAGLRAALTQLAADTGPDDRAFVYFSGHGTRRTVGEHCEQALLAHDGTALAGSELLGHLAALGDHASRVVVMIDACFAGGVTRTSGEARVGAAPAGVTRGVAAETTRMLAAGASAAPAGLRPKFAAPANDACAQPSNLLATGLPALRGQRGAVNLERNYLYLAAARDDEVAFDDEASGGLATSAVLGCLDGARGPAATQMDTDGSGALSFAELAQCAQQRLVRALPPDPRWRPQHLALTGNDAMTAAGLPAAEPAGTAATPPAATSATATASTTRALATLRDLAAGADARWAVQAQARPDHLAIGRDALSLTVTSGAAGWLYVLYVGSDQHEFRLLYPQRAADPNRLAAETPFALPRQWRSQGPAGTNHLLFVVAPEPRDFGGLFQAQPAVAASRGSAVRLHDALCLRGLAVPECSRPTVTAAEGAAPPRPRHVYGAVLIPIVESEP